MLNPSRFVLLTLVLASSTLAIADDDDDDDSGQKADKPVVPLAGRDKIAPGKPDWCGEFEPDGKVNLGMAQREVEGNGFTDKGLNWMARVACEKPNDTEVQKYVAKWRQELVNLTGMSAKETSAMLALRVDGKAFSKDLQQFCSSLEPSPEASPGEKAFAQAMATGVGCKGGTGLWITADGTAKDLGWWLDRRATVPSELVRSVFVLSCIRSLKQNSDGSYDDWPDVKNNYVLGAYASCGPDGRRLDQAAFEKQIAQAPWNDAARAQARLTFTLARTVVAHVKTDVDALIGKEPAYKKPVFDAPEAGWAQWEKDYAANKDAIEAALAFEDKFYGPSKKALQGCEQPLRKNFAAYVASKKPASVKDAHAAATDSVGYLLLQSLALCDGVEGRSLAARVELGALNMSENPIRRGPRLAAYSAAIGALGELLADRSKFPWNPESFSSVIDVPQEFSLYDATQDSIANKTVYDQPEKGTLASVKGGNVAFDVKKKTIPNRICTPNRRILAVRDGNVIYDSDCVTKGTVTFDVTPQPLTIPPEGMGGVKPGALGIFEIDQSDFKIRKGFPVECWMGEKLIGYLGVAL